MITTRCDRTPPIQLRSRVGDFASKLRFASNSPVVTYFAERPESAHLPRSRGFRRRSLHRTHNGRSASAAAIGLDAPHLPFPYPSGSAQLGGLPIFANPVPLRLGRAERAIPLQLKALLCSCSRRGEGLDNGALGSARRPHRHDRRGDRAASGDKRGLCRCTQTSAMQPSGALARRLRARFCSWRARIAVAQGAQRRNHRRKTAGIRRMSVNENVPQQRWANDRQDQMAIRGLLRGTLFIAVGAIVPAGRRLHRRRRPHRRHKRLRSPARRRRNAAIIGT